MTVTFTHTHHESRVHVCKSAISLLNTHLFSYAQSRVQQEEVLRLLHECLVQAPGRVDCHRTDVPSDRSTAVRLPAKGMLLSCGSSDGRPSPMTGGTTHRTQSSSTRAAITSVSPCDASLALYLCWRTSGRPNPGTMQSRSRERDREPCEGTPASGSSSASRPSC